MKMFLLIFLIFIGVHEHIQHQPEAKSLSALRRQLKRSGTYEEPLHVSQKKAFLQTGHTYQLPCTVIRPGDSVSIVFWLRGESLDPASRKVILRQAYPNDGLNFALHRYQISPAYGLIIDPVIMIDTNRYWCKTLRKPTSKVVEDYLDVTVLDKTFPKDNDSIVDETSVSLSIESENTILCPLLPKEPAEIQPTVYWSVMSGNDQSLDIIFAKFANGDTMLVQEYVATHGPQGNNGLHIKRFKMRDERYCCHVFEQGNDLKTACIDVTWLALATERRPTILDCNSTGESCEVEISPQQDFLQLECSINEVYPKPTLNWSYTNCEASPIFFTIARSTENHSREVFEEKSNVYLVDLPPSLNDCSLACTAHGEAIPDETEPARVTITRRTETTTSRIVTSTYTSPGSNSSGFSFTLFLTIIYLVVLLLIIVMLICPRSQKCIQDCVGGIPTLPWFPKQCAIQETESHSLTMKTVGTSIDLPEDREMTPEETIPLVTCEDEATGVADEKNRNDKNFIWNYLGQLITEPALEVKNMSGFRDIKDVIGIQDGGVLVIDSKGFHILTVGYEYRFIDLYRAFDDKKYVCVTYFADDKLLFGLEWGKLVVLDIVNEQVNNFCSVTPVKDTIVWYSSDQFEIRVCK